MPIGASDQVPAGSFLRVGVASPVTASQRDIRSAPTPVPQEAKKWGSVARHGAQVLGESNDVSASNAWRQAVVRARTDPEGAEDEEVWVRDEEPEAPAPIRTASGGGRPRHTVPAPVAAEITGAAGARAGAKLAERLAEAVHAYDRDRFQDSLRILRPLARAVPTAGAVRELLGLTLYRLGRWRPALKELEEYRTMSGSYDQLPAMMDCNRALHLHSVVDQLWEDLREASPSGEVVAEGRIVMAGSLADRGDISGAIRLLTRDAAVKKPRLHHLREWYALADLYERAGDVSRARELFAKVDAIDPDAFDTRDRLRALR